MSVWIRSAVQIAVFFVKMFLYICANPFIYATKFDPVRKVLASLVLCKKPSVEPATGTGGAPPA